jgi:DNA mismatch endonuclease, patch repair protein
MGNDRRPRRDSVQGNRRNRRSTSAEAGDSYLRDGRAPVPRNVATSRSMRGNKLRGTRPELALRRVLRKAGIRGFRLHDANLPGRPDVVFADQHVATFVNGCFWHRCPRCRLPLPKTHGAFWRAKFRRNTARDRRNSRLLRAAGWGVYVVWECRLRDEPEVVVSQLSAALSDAASRSPGGAS